MTEIIQAAAPEHIQQIRDLFNEYIAWTHTFVSNFADMPTFKNLDDEFAHLPGMYAPPAGRLLLALDNGQPAGCIALKPITESICELKRLYVRPAYRGRQIGWRLTEKLVMEARSIGYTRMILDSHRTMTKAHSIYQAFGFNIIEPPDDAPAFLKQIAVFMAVDLV